MTEKNIDKDEVGKGSGGQAIFFEHVNSLQEVKVHAQKEATLRELWDAAYEQLSEPQRSDDRLQTDGGVDVMPYLGLTLKQLREKHDIKAHKFQIVGPTGGA